MNKENIFEGSLLTIGSVYSLSNLEDLLGVIILIIQILWISSKLILKAIKIYKEKKSITDFINSIEPSDINILTEEKKDDREQR